MNTLPNEVLTIIWKYLPSSEHKKLSTVSCRFNLISNQRIFWTGVDLSHFKDIMDDNSLIILFKTKFKSVAEISIRLFFLNLSGCSRLTQNSLDLILELSRYARKLDFSGCLFLSDHFVTTVLNNSKKLSCLVLNDTMLTNSALQGLDKACIQELYLERCPNVKFESLSIGVNLQILDVRGNFISEKTINRFKDTCEKLIIY
jgi:hypothetical protein